MGFGPGGVTGSKTSSTSGSDGGIGGLFGSIGHALAEGAKAVGGFIYRVGIDLPRVFQPIVHDVAAIATGLGYAAQELWPGGAEPALSHFWEYPAIEAQRPGGLGAPLYEEIKRRVANVPISLSELGKADTWKHPSRALRVIVDSPLGLVLPIINSIEQTMTPEGRKQMWEHPLFTLLDVLPATKTLGKALGPVGHVLETLGEETKLGQNIGAYSAGIRSKLGYRQQQVAKVVHTVAREAQSRAADQLDEIYRARKKIGTSDWEEINNYLTRPDIVKDIPDVERAEQVIGDIKNLQETRGAALVAKDKLPDEYETFLRSVAMNHTPAGGKSYRAEMTETLYNIFERQGKDPTRAADIMAHMDQAFKDGAPNPFAGEDRVLDSVWKKMENRYNAARRIRVRAGQNFLEPVTGGQYALQDFRALKKRIYRKQVSNLNHVPGWDEYLDAPRETMFLPNEEVQVPEGEILTRRWQDQQWQDQISNLNDNVRELQAMKRGEDPQGLETLTQRLAKIAGDITAGGGDVPEEMSNFDKFLGSAVAKLDDLTQQYGEFVNAMSHEHVAERMAAAYPETEAAKEVVLKAQAELHAALQEADLAEAAGDNEGFKVAQQKIARLEEKANQVSYKHAQVRAAEMSKPEKITVGRKMLDEIKHHPGRTADTWIEVLGRKVSEEISAGKGLSPESEAYLDAIVDMPPPSYNRYFREQRLELKSLEKQAALTTGPERASILKAASELKTSMRAQMLKMISEGERPIMIPAPAKAGPLEETILPKLRSRSPGSEKSAQGLPPAIEADAFVALTKDVAEQVLRDVTLQALPEAWRLLGGLSWDSKWADLTEGGWFKPERASKLLKKEYDGFFVDAGGHVEINHNPGPGDMLIPKGAGRTFEKAYFPGEATPMQKGLKYWMIPSLLLAPMFQVANVFGGALLTALRTKPNIHIFRDAREAIQAALAKRIIDPRIPHGTGLAPMYGDLLNPTQESLYAAFRGEGLVSAVKKWSKNPVRAVVQLSENTNHFFDQMYRNFMFLNHGGTRGAIEKGLRAAQLVLQDIDSMLPFEREVMQRLIPFWTWKRTVLRHVMTYPIDHPIRTTILNQMARMHSEQMDASQWLDDHERDYLPIEGIDAEGYQKYIRIAQLNPFNDIGQFGTLAGWLNATNPYFQTAIEAVTGYNGYIGGVPAHAGTDETQLDVETGAHTRKTDWGALWNVIPQLRALKDYLGVDGPQQDTTEGWWAWWKKYGSSLRLLPGLQVINTPAEAAKHAAIEREAETGQVPSSHRGGFRPQANAIPGTPGQIVRNSEGATFYYPDNWKQIGVYQWMDPRDFPGATFQPHWVLLDPTKTKQVVTTTPAAFTNEPRL